MEKKSFDIKKFLMKYVMYLFLILMCIVLTVASDKFLTVTNLMTIIKQISIQSIVAIGMTMIIISGNIDLSVGSLVALCSVSGAMIMNKGLPMIAAVIASVIIGALVGFITGGVTAKLKLHSFLVTLSLMTALRGLAQTMTNGRPVAGLPSAFGKIASASIGPVPLLVIYMIVLYAIFMYVMKYTAFGRSIYAVGSNQESARLSGINIEMVKTMVFVISGALCGIAGVLLTAKVRSGDPTCANAW